VPSLMRFWPTSSQLCIGVMLVPLLHSASTAQIRAASEPELKAAFVFNFARFVEWPNSSFGADQATFRICVGGSASIAELIEQITSDKALAGRKIEVRSVKSNDSRLRECQILLVESGSPDAFLDATRNSSVLTVGNGTQFIEKGGLVDFIKEQNTTHFEINPDLAQRLQLRISSKLLALARLVRSTQP